jgi:ketosteroid isomerase-like protein
MMSGESQATAPDRIELERLNREYIHAFMTADAAWYREHLAEDFVCIDSDGAVLDKPRFLAQVAKGPDVAAYDLEEVHIRISGDIALIRATGRFSRADESIGLSRYVDVYARDDGTWKTISAQITRTSP